MTNTETLNTSTTDVRTPETVVDLHLRAYCEPDAARRAELFAAAWHADGTLVDPPFDGAGLEALAGMTDVVLTHYPAHTFRRTTGIDAHHAFARYGWSLDAPDGTVAVTGTDIAEFGDDGRGGGVRGGGGGRG